MTPQNFDIDILRTLVAVNKHGNLLRAAESVGRSQSAASQQLKKLEEQVGSALFHRNGRGLALTDAGEMMLSYARRMIELNDHAAHALIRESLSGTVKFGLPGDFAESWLPAALGEFKRNHRGVHVEVQVDGNGKLLEQLDEGRLDLALVMNHANRDGAHELVRIPMNWISSVEETGRVQTGIPVELALYRAPCFFRAAAIAALDGASIPWRLSYTTASLNSLWAGVTAGLGITARIAHGLPAGIRTVAEPSGLPPLPTFALCLHRSKRNMSSAAEKLFEVVSSAVTRNMHDSRT